MPLVARSFGATTTTRLDAREARASTWHGLGARCGDVVDVDVVGAVHHPLHPRFLGSVAERPVFAAADPLRRVTPGTTTRWPCPPTSGAGPALPSTARSARRLPPPVLPARPARRRTGPAQQAPGPRRRPGGPHRRGRGVLRRRGPGQPRLPRQDAAQRARCSARRAACTCTSPTACTGAPTWSGRGGRGRGGAAAGPGPGARAPRRCAAPARGPGATATCAAARQAVPGPGPRPAIRRRRPGDGRPGRVDRRRRHRRRPTSPHVTDPHRPVGRRRAPVALVRPGRPERLGPGAPTGPSRPEPA